jgi:hypothetical protein
MASTSTTRTAVTTVTDGTDGIAGTAATRATAGTARAAGAAKRVTLVTIVKPLSTVERLLKRDEADLILVAGNAALVVLEVIEWPVAALFLFAHLLHRTRFKGISALVEVVEEVE